MLRLFSGNCNGQKRNRQGAGRPASPCFAISSPPPGTLHLPDCAEFWVGRGFELAAELLPESEPLGERLSQAAAGPLEHVLRPGPPPTCPQLWLPAAVPGQTGPQQPSRPGRGIGGRVHRCCWFCSSGQLVLLPGLGVERDSELWITAD